MTASVTANAAAERTDRRHEGTRHISVAIIVVLALIFVVVAARLRVTMTLTMLAMTARVVPMMPGARTKQQRAQN